MNAPQVDMTNGTHLAERLLRLLRQSSFRLPFFKLHQRAHTHTQQANASG